MSRRIIPDAAKNWVYGMCYPFAFALHERTGWPMRGLAAIRDPKRGVQIAHLWVERPDGTPIDAGGTFEVGELTAFFMDGERQSTRDSMHYRDFPDCESFMQFAREAEPDYAQSIEHFFEEMAPRAAAALEAFASEHLAELLEYQPEPAFEL